MFHRRVCQSRPSIFWCVIGRRGVLDTPYRQASPPVHYAYRRAKFLHCHASSSRKSKIGMLFCVRFLCGFLNSKAVHFQSLAQFFERAIVNEKSFLRGSCSREEFNLVFS